MVGGSRPNPHSSTASSSTPSVGSARNAFTPVTTRNDPRPVCPMARPIGIAISADTATATPVYCRCSRMRAPMPVFPAQFSAVKM